MVQLKHAGDGRLPPSRGTPAPEALPPSRWVTALFCLGMLTWVLAFRPDPWVWATVPGIVGWLAVVERSRTLREAILWLGLFGAVGTAIGYSWLAVTVQEFGDVSVVASWILVALFGVVGTVHAWILAVVYRSMLKRGRRPHPLVTVSLIVACESLPIRLFAWSSGYGAVNVPPLLQVAEWGGVAAVSFALCCLVVPVYEWLRWAFVRGGAPARPVAAAVTFFVGLVLFGVGALRYQQVNAEDDEAPRRLRVAIAQANIGTHAKRRATENQGREIVDNLAAYRAVTEKAAALEPTPQLIVWPETAITVAVPMVDKLQTNTFLRREGYGFLNEIGEESAFLVGLYEQVSGRHDIVSGKRLQSRYNVAGLRQVGGMETASWSTYKKVHLIPFGETMPLGILQDRIPHKHNMLAGEPPEGFLQLESPKVSLAPFICYEGILADSLREYVRGERPDVLVSLTNDSWFGGSWEPYQHLNFTRFRAVEHRAPLVRSTNTGVSAFVSSSGDVVSSLDVGARDVIVASVPLVERQPTLYVRLGHRLPLALWIFVLVAWTLALMRPPPLG